MNRSRATEFVSFETCPHAPIGRSGTHGTRAPIDSRRPKPLSCVPLSQSGSSLREPTPTERRDARRERQRREGMPEDATKRRASWAGEAARPAVGGDDEAVDWQERSMLEKMRFRWAGSFTTRKGGFVEGT